jgi:hypothetical protein
MENSTWGDMTVLQYLGQGLADRKDQRIRDNNRLDRGGVALDPDLALEIKQLDTYIEDSYNKMLISEYTRRVPENVRQWAASVPGMASGELFPRIIASLGHPRIALPRRPDPDDPQRGLIAEPSYIRGPQELRQYAGAGDPDRKPAKGMTQDDLFAMGKVRQIRPLLFTWSTGLVKMSTPAKEGSKNPGQPKSLNAASSRWWKIFTQAKRRYAGHDGKCSEGAWPLECAGTHRKHWGAYLRFLADVSQPEIYDVLTREGIRDAVVEQSWLNEEKFWEVRCDTLTDKEIAMAARGALISKLGAINHDGDPDVHITWGRQCQNKKVPPARPNGCGIGAHREWGEIGAPWRPGHIDMAAHRKLHQQFLNELWFVAGEDGLTPYEFEWRQNFRGFKN